MAENISGTMGESLGLAVKTYEQNEAKEKEQNDKKELTKQDLEIAYITNTYVEERNAVQNPLCDYSRLVLADVRVSEMVADLALEVDNINADVGLKGDAADWSEAKIERVFKNESRELRHLLRIFESLYTTIKSKMYRESK